MSQMLEQLELPLFGPAGSHSGDPISSYQAAERLHRSGKLDSQRLAVFQALRLDNGSTSAELARYMGVDRHIPARRLPELANQNLIIRGPTRQCKVTRNLCVT